MVGDAGKVLGLPFCPREDLSLPCGYTDAKWHSELEMSGYFFLTASCVRKPGSLALLAINFGSASPKTAFWITKNPPRMPNWNRPRDSNQRRKKTACCATAFCCTALLLPGDSIPAGRLHIGFAFFATTFATRCGPG